MSSNVTNNRKCPNCGASNSGLSLFCAECGTALNGGTSQDTTAIRAANGDDASQQTQAFNASTASWSPSDTSAYQPAAATVSPESTWQAPAFPLMEGTAELGDQSPAVQTSPRSFFLGLLAIILILAVIGLFVWASLLSGETRDTITGWI